MVPDKIITFVILSKSSFRCVVIGQMATVPFVPSSHSDLSTAQFVPPAQEIAAAVGGGILAHAIVTTAIATLTIEQRGLRFLVALLNIAVCVIIISQIDRTKIYGGQMTVYMICQMMQGNWTLLLNPVEMDPGLSLGVRLCKSLYVALDPRPSSRQSRSRLPEPNVALKQGQAVSKQDAKLTFILTTLSKILWTSLLYYLFEHHFRLNVRLPDFDKTHDQSVLYRLTQFDVRFFLSCFYIEALGDFQQYWIIEFIHGWCAIFGVAALNHDPADWIPLWGDLRDAYTMARFYAYWWHKILRKQLIENSRALLQLFVFLPKGIRNSRFAVVIAVFVFSALMHGMAFSSASRCLDNRVVTYFALLAPTVLLEELVQRLFSPYFTQVKAPQSSAEIEKSNITALSKEHNSRTDRTTSRWRYVGYCWVILYKCWVVPRSLSRSKICF